MTTGSDWVIKVDSTKTFYVTSKKSENSETDNGDGGHHGKAGLLNINYTEQTLFTSIYVLKKHRKN